MRRLISLTLLCAACSGAPEVQVTEVADVGVSAADAGTRSWKRMDIDQVEASILRATGGIGWTERVDGQTVSLFDHLAGTLGKPEYLARTDEDLVPGLLFQKFLDDAAKSTCTRLIDAEKARSPGERVLIRPVELDETFADEAQTRKAVSRAILQFHGRNLATDDAEIDLWYAMMQQATAATGDNESAWRSLCVALMTHPDFYSY